MFGQPGLINKAPEFFYRTNWLFSENLKFQKVAITRSISQKLKK